MKFGGFFCNLRQLTFICFALALVAESSFEIYQVQYELYLCGDYANASIEGHTGRVPAADLSQTNLIVASKLICAIMTNKRQAEAYTYESGACTLFGEGLAKECRQIVYGPMEFLPMDDLEEVARGKTVHTSSVLNTMVGDRVLDDDVNTEFHSALDDKSPWWMVDLGEERIIHQVQILPRQNCCHKRLHDVEVRIGSTLQTDGNFASHPLMTFFKGPYTKEDGLLVFSDKDGFPGRYLSIKMMVTGDADYLHIRKIKVFAAK